jgi:hypothetical protein
MQRIKVFMMTLIMVLFSDLLNSINCYLTNFACRP